MLARCFAFCLCRVFVCLAPARRAQSAASGGGATLLKKDLVAHAEALTTKDRVLVIGNSREPFDDSVDQDELKEFFTPKGHGKAIFMPYPDYATRLKLYTQFITAKGLDVTVLNQVCLVVCCAGLIRVRICMRVLFRTLTWVYLSV